MAQVDYSTLSFFKEQYNGYKIIYIRFSDSDFIFRTLTRKEFKYIMSSQLSKMDFEDAICNVACVYPEEYDFETCGFAGLNEFVSEIIIKASGFNDLNDILYEYQLAKSMNNLETQCMDIIKAFIPEYSYEAMENWTWEKLMQMTVKAENVARLKGYDYHIEVEEEKYTEAHKTPSIDDPETIQECIKKGIDPMFYFKDELKKPGEKLLIDLPFIIGSDWRSA